MAGGVVVVGGGFAGVACARALGRAGRDVTLLDRNTYHQFQPLLYQVATAQLAPTDVMSPLRGIFRRQDTVAVKNADVVGIDPATRTARTATGESFSGDHLVLATGSRPNFFGIDGAAEHAYPLYSAADAERLRDRVLRLFEDADLRPDRLDQGALDFVIVGAGPTGVETAGALADLVNDVMPDRYHDLDVSRARILLVDHSDTVLKPFSERSHDYAAEVLTERGVELLLGRSVTEVRADGVVLGDGTVIPSHCVIWAGGLQAAGWAEDDDLPRGRGGRIEVGPDHAVAGFDGVWALGDAANIAGPDGRALPQLGSVALQAGRSVAEAIVATDDGRTPEPFAYHDKGIMAMIGRKAAIAEVGAHHHELRGAVAHSAWLGVHAWLLGSARARIDAFVSWAWDAFSADRSPASIHDPDAARIDWSDDVTAAEPPAEANGDQP